MASRYFKYLNEIQEEVSQQMLAGGIQSFNSEEISHSFLRFPFSFIFCLLANPNKTDWNMRKLFFILKKHFY